MKYADGPSTEVTADIAAPPGTVWDTVTDINAPARFSEEFQGASWCDGVKGPLVGASFTGRNCHPAIGEWETTSFVTECDPGRRFAWAVTDAGNPSATWWFGLEPAGAGTRLTMGVRLGPGRSGLNAAIDARPDKEERIVERRLDEHRVNMARTVAGIKELAESE